MKKSKRIAEEVPLGFDVVSILGKRGAMELESDTTLSALNEARILEKVDKRKRPFSRGDKVRYWENGKPHVATFVQFIVKGEGMVSLDDANRLPVVYRNVKEIRRLKPSKVFYVRECHMVSGDTKMGKHHDYKKVKVVA